MRKETPPSSSLRKICLDLCARKRFAHFSCHYVTQQIQKQIQDSHKIRLDLWLQGNTFHSIAQHFRPSGNDIWWQNQKNLQASLQVTAEHQNANEMRYMCLWNLKLGLRWLRWCTLCTSCQWASCLWRSFRIAAQWIGTGWQQQCTIGWRWMEKDMSRWVVVDGSQWGFIGSIKYPFIPIKSPNHNFKFKEWSDFFCFLSSIDIGQEHWVAQEHIYCWTLIELWAVLIEQPFTGSAPSLMGTRHEAVDSVRDILMSRRAGHFNVSRWWRSRGGGP